ncbi:MAG: molybdenum cofactor guanylyltransferase MobA [Burkholderiales bacterium]
MKQSDIHRSAPITGVVLAGGQGRRMGGVDKGLKLLRGKPMIDWVLERFVPQVDEVLVNANQNIEKYAAYGHRVIPDVIGGYAGPLAGLHRGLTEARHDLVATVPCDSPFLPADLVSRLQAHLNAAGVDLAVARTGEQPHPVFCLCRKSVLASLMAFLDGGGRKIDAWYSALAVVEVSFDDQPDAFRNINTQDELTALQNTPLA